MHYNHSHITVVHWFWKLRRLSGISLRNFTEYSFQSVHQFLLFFTRSSFSVLFLYCHVWKITTKRIQETKISCHLSNLLINKFDYLPDVAVPVYDVITRFIGLPTPSPVCWWRPALLTCFLRYLILSSAEESSYARKSPSQFDLHFSTSERFQGNLSFFWPQTETRHFPSENWDSKVLVLKWASTSSSHHIALIMLETYLVCLFKSIDCSNVIVGPFSVLLLLLNDVSLSHFIIAQ